MQSLTEKLENLESENRDLHLSLSPPRPMSPLSLSSPPDIDSPLSSSANSSVLMEQLDQLEFDKEEIQTKYEEMKVRDIYQPDILFMQATCEIYYENRVPVDVTEICIINP